MSVSPEADDEPLQLHQEALCAALRQVVASDDLVRLRAGVAALRQQLVAGELRADTGNGVTVGQTRLVAVHRCLEHGNDTPRSGIELLASA
jgi:hypothetical protein